MSASRIGRHWTIAALAIFFSTGGFINAASALPLKVTDARIQGGRLIVTGTTPTAHEHITLDSRYAVTSNAQRAFTFNLGSYRPPSCIASLKAGAAIATAVVAYCGPQGVSPRGGWSASAKYLTNDLVLYQGSTWRAKAANNNKEPDLAPSVWEKFAAKGDTGATGPQGPTGATGTVGKATVRTTVASADLPQGTTTSYNAFCLAGQQAIGGGGRGDGTNSQKTSMTSSRPAVSPIYTEPPTNGQSFTGWRITVTNVSGGAGIRPQVWVVCVAAP